VKPGNGKRPGSWSRHQRVLVIGKTPLGEQVTREIASRPWCGVVVGVFDDHVSASVDSEESVRVREMARLEAIIDKLSPDHIVVALTERRNRTPLMQALLTLVFARGITIESGADCYERLTGKLALESWTPMSVVFSGKLRPSRAQQIIARVISVAVAVVTLVLLLPLFLIIALAIKLDSRGPILFVQERVGAYGRPFRLFKFRSMHDGTARRSEWEQDNRDHVTRVGRWLRAFRLDELPQLLNIIRGEMNLVGPRPHPTTNLELFTLVARNLNELTGAAISCYALRTLVLPGITGWAQVRYRYANNLAEEIEKLRYDLYYIKHMSSWLDLLILFETVKVMCRYNEARAEAVYNQPRAEAVYERARAEAVYNQARAEAVVTVTAPPRPAAPARKAAKRSARRVRFAAGNVGHTGEA
jgi:exopolysaccharide biosynthesis polyprenyl glycosylphosphotransferase